MTMVQNVTYVKAVGIVLMVIAHSHCGIPYVFQVIYMFHMPLFFFCSGYCFKPKYYKEPHIFVWRRIKGIWWPYAKWSLLFLLLHNIFYYVGFYNYLSGDNWNHTFALPEIQSHAHSILLDMEGHEQLLGGFWFMKALFYGALIGFATLLTAHLMSIVTARLLGETSKKHVIYGLYSIICGSVVLLVACWLNSRNDTLTRLMLTPKEFLSAVFFVVGHVFAYTKASKFRLWSGLLSFAVVVVGSFFWWMEMASSFFDNSKMFPYTVTAILGTWTVFSLPWHRVKGKASTLLSYIGNHTLTILTWHFVFFKMVSYVIVLIYGLQLTRLSEMPVIVEYAQKGWWLIYAVAGISVPLMLNFILSKLPAAIQLMQRS